MRWESARRSTNVEDRRGMGGGMGGGRMLGGGGIGMLILILIISFITGRNPLELMQQVETTAPPAESAPTGTPSADDPAAQFVSAVLGDTEDTWSRLFESQGRDYQEPVLVLFEGAVQSNCGYASSQVGPFYCPADRKVYLDLNFFRDLDRRFGAPGDFAAAYVVAHEVGHHIQTLLGISARVHQSRSRMSETQANELSVRQELQADCFAGVWGHHAERRQLLDPGDVDEGLAAAAAIGDDRLQKQGQGHVAPESFTHGTSEQRVRWLKRGLESGDPNQCDTLNRTAY